MDYTYDICRAPYTPDCPSDTAYDAAAQMCVQAPQCSNGLLDASADKCYQSASGGCLSGYSLNGGVCIKTPTCNSGGTFSSATDQCTYAATHTCASGYVYSSSSGECERGADCPSPGSLNGTVDQCQAGYTLSCPSGFTGSGSICYRETNCSSPGSYSSDQDKCLSTVDRICATGFAYDASTEQCWAGSDCGSGTLNTSADRCEATAMANCGSWSWDSAGQVCYSPAMCSPGAYNPGANECRATIVRDCGSYLWNETDKKCTQGVQCLDQEPDFPTASTIDFSPELDICVANSQHGCPTGYAYAGLPVAMCESPTACPEGPYDPEQNQCEGGDICPLGSQYACLGEQGATQCSPNTCFDLFAAGNDMTELPPEDPMLQNDGDVDANGNCLGDIYIFSGKAARCRPPGATVGYANDCCDSDEPALTDSTTGSRISQIASAIQTVYEVAQVGYYAYQLSTGAMAAVEVGGQVMVYNMATGSIAATYASGTATASGVMAAQGAAAAGGTSGGAVSAGISSYAGALLNPTTIVVAIVVMVVMKVMFGSGCSQQDIETAMLDNSDYCIYLGKVCERKWPLVGCVQRAKRFCCFNSTMARIVQEQGRPQLKAFGRSGSWGSAEKPNCRGFTPEEFQQLDFSLIDLTEYFGQIQKNMTQKIQDAQSAVQQKIQQHYQQIQ
jgi:conjugal transfer mating pair stabilization protein TraN